MATTYSPASTSSHSLTSLGALGAAAFATYSTVRSTDVNVQIPMAVLSVLSFLAFLIVRPGGPDMLKTVRQNEKDATALQQESFKLFSIIATTLAGQDRSKWREIMDDVDSVTTEFPQDVRKDLHEAGKIMTASNWAAEVYQSRVGLSKWWNAEQDADQMAQAFKCLQEISATLKVRGNVSFVLLAAKTNGNKIHNQRL